MPVLDDVRLPEVVVPGIGIPKIPDPVDTTITEIFHTVEKYSHKPLLSCSGTGLGKKQGTKVVLNGFHLDSIWEAAFYIYQTDILGNYCVRNTKESVQYTNTEGKRKSWYPDFIVNGMLCEVKGIYRPNDICKRDTSSKFVQFYDGAQIRPMMKVLDKQVPDWRKRFKKDFGFHARYGKHSKEAF